MQTELVTPDTPAAVAEEEEEEDQQEEAPPPGDEVALQGNLCTKYVSVLADFDASSNDKYVAILMYLASIKHWPNVRSFCVQLHKQDGARYQAMVDQFPRVPFCI